MVPIGNQPRIQAERQKMSLVRLRFNFRISPRRFSWKFDITVKVSGRFQERDFSLVKIIKSENDKLSSREHRKLQCGNRNVDSDAAPVCAVPIESGDKSVLRVGLVKQRLEIALVCGAMLGIAIPNQQKETIFRREQTAQPGSLYIGDLVGSDVQICLPFAINSNNRYRSAKAGRRVKQDFEYVRVKVTVWSTHHRSIEVGRI